MTTGTTSEGALQLAGRTIEIAGEGKDLSILECSQPSSLLSLSSGTVSLEDVGFTQHSLLLSTDRTESLFVVNGGRLTLTSARISRFSINRRHVIEMSGSGSLLSLSNSGSIAIDRCSFVGMKVSGNGGVFSSELNTGNSLSITNSDFDGCESRGKGGALHLVSAVLLASIPKHRFGSSCALVWIRPHSLWHARPSVLVTRPFGAALWIDQNCCSGFVCETVFDLIVEREGQIVVNQVASSLPLSSLSVPISDLTAGRTEELVSISAGSLTAKSCTFGSTTQTMPVRNPSASVALFSVSGGTLTVKGSISSMLSASPPFELSSSAAVVLDSIVTDVGNGQVSTLISQNGGYLSILNTDLRHGRFGETLFCGNMNVEVKSSQFSSLVPHTESDANTLGGLAALHCLELRMTDKEDATGGVHLTLFDAVGAIGETTNESVSSVADISSGDIDCERVIVLCCDATSTATRSSVSFDDSESDLIVCFSFQICIDAGSVRGKENVSVDVLGVGGEGGCDQCHCRPHVNKVALLNNSVLNSKQTASPVTEDHIFSLQLEM
ncbi:hypothetical protein BLNAU_13382 [Blattamonas nauphoetae]|uniref:Right handed beta helix domain-containing protein n=1 Tax=Blattamonas nauphoetae TaxID=2049346 RepID=A0ABQ9XGS1_9EUKA|nr:hypothetical protein BLNAU_13382 [Blattamonas nauphoetae]